MVPQTNDGRHEDPEAVSREVVESVAAARDTDPLDLPPLYEVVDPDALNRLFDYDQTTTPAPACVRFRMADCNVVVHRDGTVEVTADPTTATVPSAEPDATGTALD